MSAYQKKGYLIQEFKIFRLKDASLKPIPAHYHEFHKIIVFLNGKSDYVIEGKRYTLEPNDMIFIRAGEVHQPLPSPDVPYERIIIYIDTSFLDNYKRGTDDLAACFTLASKQSASVMHLTPGKSHDLMFHIEKLEFAAKQKGFANALYIDMLFLEFMILVNRALLGHELAAAAPVYDTKILPIIDYINDHLCEDLSVDTLAEQFFLSKYHMMRRFKKATGYSIHRYITNKRLLKARALLKEEIPLTKLCYDCGFHDYSSFSRAFKEKFRQTPQKYRKNLQLE